MNLAVLRLTALGSRGSWGRLVAITSGVAAGVTLFLLLWGASDGLAARDLRSSWMNASGEQVAAMGDAVPRDDAVMAAPVTDYHDGAIIRRLAVAATPDSRVALPGIETAPAPGEYYGSPALVALIDSVPAGELGDRYGTLVGILPNSVLASPDSLVAITGLDVDELSPIAMTTLISDFTGVAYGGNSNYHVVAIVGGIAILFPVFLFIGIVTKLGSAQRQERFATLRLIGAAPQTVVGMATWETAVTSLVGAALGVLFAYLLRPLAARVSLGDGSFFTTDLAVSPVGIVAVVAVTVVVSAIAAARGIHRAGIGALGVTKQQQERMPRPRRLAPLAIGLATMLAVVVGSQTGAFHGLFPGIMELLLVVGFVLTSLGIVVAGPYLTFLAGRVVARYSSSAAGVIAANRIHRSPVATFRAVSGLVIAVFMVSVFAAAATTATETPQTQTGPGLLSPSSLMVSLYAVPSEDDLAAVVTQTVARLEATEGVDHVTVGRMAVQQLSNEVIIPSSEASILGFDDIPDADYLAFDVNAFVLAGTEEPAQLSPTTVSRFADLAPSVLYVHTDGSAAAIERARTVLELSGVVGAGRNVPGTRIELADSQLQTMVNSFAGLAYLGIAIATLIAGISLAVSAAAAILDRKRTLGLLRLVGMPVSSLRRIVSYEAALPLIAVLALSIAFGFFVAWLILTGLTDGRRTVSWPDPRYALALVASVGLALAAVTATFGTIRKNTAVSSTRYE